MFRRARSADCPRERRHGCRCAGRSSARGSRSCGTGRSRRWAPEDRQVGGDKAHRRPRPRRRRCCRWRFSARSSRLAVGSCGKRVGNALAQWLIWLICRFFLIILWCIQFKESYEKILWLYYYNLYMILWKKLGFALNDREKSTIFPVKAYVKNYIFNNKKLPIVYLVIL